ncbi:DUF2059 domain-containing protein [Pseudodonghicola flavimaris]|uniref:DUF2059 domain-containing protein n=1 Tax=Pseudodonghicola flavimaris TaxID=3050036 RepID=A0ABT7F0U4_9RHOB|nr:DUF2059 domain-containing protein [Pseudodonghicola flavimaris]MDK3018234.1 DUF2059 domain-containing protein [Pseudodonghicola flavimaris]
MSQPHTARFAPLFPLPLRHLLPRVTMFALALAVTLACLFLPQAGQAADRQRIEAFLKVTGFDVALDSIALSASAAPKMLGVDPGAFGSEWERLSQEVFDPKTMRTMALELLEPTLSDNALAHAAEFYASDLGQRLVAAENASQQRSDDQAKKAEGETILDDLRQSDPERVARLQQMTDATGADETSLRALQEIQFRFLMAASAAGVVELRTDADGLRALLKRNEAELRAAIRASALAGAAYTYRDFTTAEIASYTEALKTPEMQSVYELLSAVQFEIMANRFEALAARMAGLRPGQDI